jgi:hypothetical protein
MGAMIGSAFAQEPGSGPPSLGGGSLGSWAFSYIDTIGVALLALMVLLVLWRALTRQPVTVAEALVGVIGIFAIVLPLLTQFSLEAFGVKAEGSFARNRDDFAASIAELKTRVVALEETAKALQVQITAVATAVSPQASREVRSIQPESMPSSVTLIYYLSTGRDSKRGDAIAAQEALTGLGFQSTLIATDFTEMSRSSGDIVRIRFASGAEAAAEQIAGALGGIFGEGRVLLVRPATELANGDVQIQIL